MLGESEPVEATYVLAADYHDWKALFEGYDALRTVMYRKLLLEDGDLLEFFKAIYFFVESSGADRPGANDFPGELRGARRGLTPKFAHARRRLSHQGTAPYAEK